MNLALLAAAWLTGTLLGLTWTPPLAATLPLAAIAALTATALRLARQPALPALLAAILSLSLARVGIDAPTPSVAQFDGQHITAQGQITSDPETAATKIRFRLKISQAQLQNPHPASQTAHTLQGQTWLVYTNPPADLAAQRNAPHFRYGDLVSLSGALQQPRPIDGFDYPAHLAAQGITATFFAQDAQVTGAAGAKWRAVIYQARNRLADALERTMPYPESALASAILLGKRQALPPDLVDQFRGAGAAHLLAISGLHVGVLLAAAAGAASWLLGRRRPAWLITAAAAIWLYALTAGAPPSAVRAAIMGTVYLAAIALGRPSSALPALALAAALMTALSPTLIRQISFQLSFAAVGGIALALTLSRNKLAGYRSPRNGWRGWLTGWAISLTAISTAATLATWPLVAAYFGEIPLMGIPTSLLAIPAMAPAVISAAATAAAGLAPGPLGELLGWLAAAPAAYLIAIVSTIPAWTITTPWAAGPFLYLWYGALALALLTARPHRINRWRQALAQSIPPPSAKGFRNPLRTSGGPAIRLPNPRITIPAALALSLAAAILWARAADAPDGNGLLTVHFFDIGQGDSILIVTPSGRRALIDGGPDAQQASQALAAATPGANRNLDLAIMTHPDADHGRGLLEVLDRYKVSAALSGPPQPDNDIQAQWNQRLQKNNITQAQVTAGYTIHLDDSIELQVLNPPPDPISNDSNNNSIVIHLTYNKISFLLTADIDQSTEERLIRENPQLSATVLKVAHHGSNTATGQKFLTATNPSIAIISAGSDNSYGHPSPAVIQRLETHLDPKNIYRTDLQGNITVTTDGVTVQVQTER